MAAGAAGSGGKHSPAKLTRAQKHTEAHAAGRRGEPAPGWIDDADLLDSYDTGLAAYEDAESDWDTEPSADSDTDSDSPVEASSGPAAPSAPAPAPASRGKGSQGGSGSRKSRSVGPFQPKGTAGDVAGAFLGIIAAAFVTNVIRGTWTDWLRAKALNKVTGTTANGFKAAPPVTTGPNGSASVGPSTPGGPSGPSITNNPDGSQSLSPGGID